ncbi:M20/M25/M40 family metallo-hydrolase [Flagellimonas nanhaiensis]|uniref:M20/M25/M40 family metallo-hydrolase n=1 Tax=Flagellimonas nanhaiensis TaxID=2292706 RepID=A0A371JT23_9FLAO|nr:M20/M25/M40 family metallo-hydrolase [Allomuricauda nanhaiensis]RDY60970.1 M20/M25/M40 family metallo-hydrolase [Allomuricauda nanhaiensis]
MTLHKYLTIGCMASLQLLFIATMNAQQLSKEQIKNAAENALPTAVNNLMDFLKIPNDGNYTDQIEGNLQRCDQIFTELGFDTQRLKTTGAPLLFAEKRYANNTKTLLFYLQIDGQPVDSTKWHQPSPYDPVLKRKNANDEWEIVTEKTNDHELDENWRIFARSASDSKGPAMSFITALRVLKEMKVMPRYNIKVIMDFQEELGSPHLPEAVDQYADLLTADGILIMDGTRHLSNLPTLTYGARGIATATITFFGPRRALHSGQYGNFAPNPVFEASRFLASLKNEDGLVQIPGYYDGIALTDEEKKRLNQIPEDMQEIKESLGISKPDLVGGSYQESLQYPSLNIRGLKAAWVGKEVRTLIPSEVIAEIDMRLVPESDGERLMGLLKQFIQDKGYYLVESTPTDEERKSHSKLASFKYRLGSQPFRTNFDSSMGLMLSRAMTRVFEDQFVNMRTTGGSQPIAPFINKLGVPAVSLRIPNPDNSIHAPNENFRIGNFREGIMSCLAVLTEPMD